MTVSNSTEDQARSLDALVAGSKVIICCGSGGVGKTTSAAVVAMHAARSGRRAVVVTIDPAKRLADALGLDGLSNDPASVNGPWESDNSGGQLWAMMLDTKSTFDGLVQRYSTSDDQARRILDNTFYKNISGALSGTQEYMASEKLYELAVERDYDLVVVDTPPTRNALDFLEAPQRLARFLDHRLYKVLTMPTKGLVKAVNLAAQTVMRSIARVVGAEVIADAIAFFAAFEGMEEGFKERARRVDTLLRDDSTNFVLVASPRSDTVSEASYFASELDRLEIRVRALIVNRMSPAFAWAEADHLNPPAGSALADLVECLRQARLMYVEERLHLRDIAVDVSPALVVAVPALPFEVTHLESLTALENVMFDNGSLLSFDPELSVEG